jgi:outer membrane protein TolC
MRGKSVSWNQQTIKLTLSDAIFLGLRDNRSIRSAYLQRIAEKFDLRVEKERFNPKLTLTGNYGSSRSNQDGRYRTADITPTVTLLSKYGTQFSLSWTSRADNTAPAGSRSTSTSGNDATFSVSQPLLRGGGKNIATASLRLARLAEQANKLKLKATVSDTITQIIAAYNELLRSQEQLKIARDGLERSRQLAEVNKAMIAAGRMAKFEALQTEADSTTQELTVEETSNQLQASRLNLLHLLALDSNTRITAADSPVTRRTEISFGKALSAALEQQPAYLSQILASEQAGINLEVARNNQLWDVSLQASRSRQSTSGGIGSGRNWTNYVGIQANIPIGDLGLKQTEVRAKVDVKNQEIMLADARQNLEIQVDNAVRDLAPRWRQ